DPGRLPARALGRGRAAADRGGHLLGRLAPDPPSGRVGVTLDTPRRRLHSDGTHVPLPPAYVTQGPPWAPRAAPAQRESGTHTAPSSARRGAAPSATGKPR